MKKYLFNIVLVILALVAVSSCKERDEDPKINLDAMSSAKFVNPPSGLFKVTADNLPNPFHTFIIDRANYGTPIELKYQLEISTNSTFNPISNLGEITTATHNEVTYLQLNNALANLGLSANTEYVVYVRMKAYSNNSTINPAYSETITFNVIPYEPNYDALFAKLYVPGGYAGASGYQDWTPEEGKSPTLYSAGNDNKYNGFVWMNSATPEFKFTEVGGWGTDKGDISNPNTFTTLAKPGNNIKGQFANTTYFIKVDWIANTYSMQKAELGIIGDATPTGYASDTNLTFNTTTRKFEIASIALTSTGVFKFRANDDWIMKIQPKNADVTLESGKKSQVFNSVENTVSGDPNFKVAVSGNYKIELDLHNSGFYNLTVTKL